MINLKINLCFFIIILLFACPVYGESVPTRYGVAGNYGYTYDPSGIGSFALATFVAQFDYETIWPHKAPEPLRFKVEGAIGAGQLEHDDVKGICSAGIFALYYLDGFSTARIKPYVEAGIGVEYFDYQVKGQAYRINFNPQCGIGFDLNLKSEGIYLAAFRLHHLSNSNINNDNRGQNSVVLMLGRYF